MTMAQHSSITEPVMTFVRIAPFALLVALGGCRENPILPEPNERPLAVARVVLPTGPADADTFATMGPGTGQSALQFDFNGGSLDVQLDGMDSKDNDGEISEYMWQSATLIDGDAGKAQPTGMKDPLWMPEGAAKGWPEDTANPKVTITAAGVYSFNLWVTDDTGSQSEPDTIKFTVGTAVDPKVEACVEAVVPTVPDECKRCLCSASERCQVDVIATPTEGQTPAATGCNEACWTFISCLGAKCPNFTMMAMQMPPDYSCLTMNCSAEFMAGQTGATAVGACIRMGCTEQCRAMMMP
jgi:hypothetical protein